MLPLYKKYTSWFTLIEIVITITILIFIYTVVTRAIATSPQNNKERMTRVSSYLEDEIRTARQSTIIGKGYRTSTGLLIPVKERDVFISTNTIRTEYVRLDNSMTGMERELRYPFFDGDNDYQVRSLSVYAVKPTAYTYNSTSGNESFTWLTQLTLTFKQNGEIFASGPEISWDALGSWIKIRTIEIRAWYKNYEASVQLDRLWWVVNTVNLTTTGSVITITPATYWSCGTTANTCNVWSPLWYNPGSCNGYQTWACTGSNGGANDSCSIVNPTCAINGTCGSTNASYLTPTTNFCSTGNPSGITLNATSWDWMCNGISGGTNASCSMPKIIDGICGASNGIVLSSAPSADLCNSPTSLSWSVTGTWPWNWQCAGVNGGLTTSCSALVTVNYCVAGGTASCIVAPSSGTNCSLPWWWTLLDGGSTLAYQTSTVPNGSSCTSQIRTCTAWVLSGSYTYNNCTVLPPYCIIGTGVIWSCIIQ